jgi:hypothetical protein
MVLIKQAAIRIYLYPNCAAKKGVRSELDYSSLVLDSACFISRFSSLVRSDLFSRASARLPNKRLARVRLVVSITLDSRRVSTGCEFALGAALLFALVTGIFLGAPGPGPTDLGLVERIRTGADTEIGGTTGSGGSTARSSGR